MIPPSPIAHENEPAKDRKKMKQDLSLFMTGAWNHPVGRATNRIDPEKVKFLDKDSCASDIARPSQSSYFQPLGCFTQGANRSLAPNSL